MDAQNRLEITPRVIVLSIILTIILSAANAYLGLKAGLTISASIPAAILSMGILRFFRNSTILENNIVQTAASAGEALTAGIAFTIPALLLLGVTTNFNYWETAIPALLGGILGVVFSIPIRRTLLSDPELKFPEGLAIGHVLQASEQAGNSFKLLVRGGVFGAIASFLQNGTHLIAGTAHLWRRIDGVLLGGGIGFSPTLLAAGFIIGEEVALSILLGITVGWFIAIPIFSYNTGIRVPTDLHHTAIFYWLHHTRYLGVGSMFVGGVWGVATLLKPLLHAISHHSSQHAQMATLPLHERDIPKRYLYTTLLFLFPLLGGYFFYFNPFTDLNLSIMLTVLICAIVLVLGFMLSAVCAYFAGLVGSSSNPLSGLVLIAVILTALIFLFLFEPSGQQVIWLTTLTILTAAVIGASAAISNDTIQDLKAGQMIGATPWRQQAIMILGVTTCALILPAILELLYQAYGMGGKMPRPGMDVSQMLQAPQAGLIAAVVEAIFHHTLRWTEILIGAGLTLVLIVVNRVLKPRGKHIPILGFSLGMYLSIGTSSALVIGGLISYLVKRHVQHHDGKHRLAIMSACGTVAGAAIVGVVLAIPFVISGDTNVLSLMKPGFMPWDIVMGFGLIGAMYYMFKKGAES